MQACSWAVQRENILPNNIDGMQRAFYTPAMSVISVIMICTENICRSPMAEALMRFRIAELGMQKKIRVDSAGTQVSQPRQKPDARAVKVMNGAGIPITGIKARKVTPKDMGRNDYIIAMDSANYERLNELYSQEYGEKIALLPGIRPESDVVEVPDPYFGSLEGFVNVYGILDGAIERQLSQILSRNS
ncbi:MAG: protein-tyrosine phosphatase [Halioglobus sp.]